MQPGRWLIGADIGGTFTDLVLIGPDGTVKLRKVSSTADDYARAIVEGVATFVKDYAVPPEGISAVAHATTVATNAMLEHRGALTGLVTTEGFRDALEIGRMRMPRLYDLTWVKPEPLVERHLRWEVPERLDRDGNVVRPLDEEATRQAIEALVAEGVQSLAICFLHSYQNTSHERRAAALAAEIAPDLDVSTSSGVLPEIREYERMSTTVINAYIRPVVRRYLRSLRTGLDHAGFKAPVWVMQSTGGVMSSAAAGERPVQIIESGPAAGVVGAARLGAPQGLTNLISFDMGGTTAKASLVENGEFTRATEQEVGSGIHSASRLLKGGGYLVRVPSIDVAEVGAGGGSIVWIDTGGAVRVGPRSAGASPGPVAYDQGGTEPTVTDVNALLGYLNPHSLAGGSLRLNLEKAREAFQQKIVAPTGLSFEEAAIGARAIANGNMVRAVRAVSTERGRDPRDFTLFAFGGSGPVHGVDVAALIGIKKVVVPPAAGVLSALGLMLGKLEQHFVRSFYHQVPTIQPAELDAAWAALEGEALQAMEGEGFKREEIALQRSVDVRYVGQSHELALPFLSGATTQANLNALTEAYNQAHQQEYGHAATNDPVEIVNLRLIAHLAGCDSLLAYAGQEAKATGFSGLLVVPESEQVAASAMGDVEWKRQVYFGVKKGWCETPVYTDRQVCQTAKPGPFVLEEYDATTVVPPGATAQLDSGGNLVIDLSDDLLVGGVDG